MQLTQFFQYSKLRPAKARLEVEKVLELPPDDAGLQNSIVRLHNMHLDSKRSDRSRFFRRDLLVIRNIATGEMVLRYVMGNPGGNGLSITKHAAALDYDAIAVLGIRYNRDVDLVIERASRLEIYKWFYNYPDIGIRLSIRLGVLGGALGLVGVTISLMPFLFG
ncbi:hypothetical protein ACRCPS_31105 [Pseudomonas aeruginosa]